MKKMIAMMTMGMLLVLAACSGDESTNSQPKETKEVVQTKEESQGEAKEAKEEKEVVYKTQPLALALNQVILFENESGAMELTGYQQDEEGKMVVVFGYSGELKKADRAYKRYKVILDNGNAFEIGRSNLEEIRLIDDKEYHVYKSDTSQTGDIIRIDMSITDLSYNPFDEEENTVIKTPIPPSTESFELAGTQAFDVIDDTPIQRENSEMAINIAGVQAEYTEEGLLIYGDITFKQDSEEAPIFAYMQPDMGIYETKELEMETNTDTYYEGTTVSFSENVLLDFPFAKDSVHTIYFTIGNEVFGVDLNTGEEIDEIPATVLLYRDDRIESALPLEGYLDAEGNRFYDTYFNEAIFNTSRVTGTEIDAEGLSVGGYDELAFKVGATNEPTAPHTYILRVYADDYDMVTDRGTVIYESEVKHGTPLTTHTVDVSENEKVYVFIDTQVVTEDAEAENFFSYIFADAVLSR